MGAGALEYGGDDEDALLTRIAVEAALAQLSARDRCMIELVYECARPDDWWLPWPPRLPDIGIYVGVKFDGGPVSESTIRYRVSEIKAMWRGERGPLRQTRRAFDVLGPENPDESFSNP